VQISPRRIGNRGIGRPGTGRRDIGPLVDVGVDLAIVHLAIDLAILERSTGVDAAVRRGEGSCVHVLPTAGNDGDK
jgi:hypothetical protein